MAYLESIAMIIGRKEAIPGNAEALVSTDFNSRVSDITFTPNVETVSVKYATGDHGGGDVIIGRQSGDFGFNTKVNTGGTAGVAPQYGEWLIGCGLAETIHAGVGVSYAPSSSADQATLTMAKYLIERGANPKAKKYKYAGCFGNFVFKADSIGAPLSLEYTYKGKYVDVIDIADASAIAVLTGADTDIGIPFLGADITIGGVSMCVSSFSFDAGNDVQGEPCQSDNSGYTKFGRISADDPTLSMTIMQKSVADYDEMAKMVNGVDQVVEIKFNSAIPITFTIPKGQLVATPHSDSDGISSLDIQIKAKRNDSATDPEAVYELLIGTK